MAMISYGSTRCPLCDQIIAWGDAIFATSHFIGRDEHPLWRYSDAAMHWACYAQWEHQAEFASLHFDICLKSRYKEALFSSNELVVYYTPYMDEVSVNLRRTGTEKTIKRKKWMHWMAGDWYKDCRHQLEITTIRELLPQLSRVILPAPSLP
ncbi:MAG: hypothetical protein RL095_1674 [Verrucomicrobiota bacterium]|jgi:hypothetical protein